MNKVY